MSYDDVIVRYFVKMCPNILLRSLRIVSYAVMRIYNLLLYLSVYPLQDDQMGQTKRKKFEEQQNNYSFGQ